MPPENFNRDGIYHLLVWIVTRDAAKVFCFLGGSLIFIGKFKLLQQYKLEPHDNIPWQKLPKVSYNALPINADIIGFLVDYLQHCHQHLPGRLRFLEICLLSCRTRHEIRPS